MEQIFQRCARNTVLCSAWVGLLGVPSSVAALPGLEVNGSPAFRVDFGTDPLRGTWQLSTEVDMCELTQAIDGYGAARFFVEGDDIPVFELTARRVHFSEGRVVLSSVAPPWHSAYPAHRVLAQLTINGSDALRVHGELAQVMLSKLRNGWQLNLTQPLRDAVAGDIHISVSPLNIRAVYGALAECVSGNSSTVLATATAAVSGAPQTLVHFDVDDARISASDLHRLRILAQSVVPLAGASSEEFRGLVVHGHTDSTGSDTHNEVLSRRRAEAVADALIAAGIPAALVSLEHHAARYPAADNSTHVGRQHNRRAVIRLIER